MNLRIGFGPLMVCSALLGVAQMASAQPKITVINLQRAVLESAEIKKADADMQARYKPRSAALEQLQKDIAGIAQQLQANAGKFTPQAEAELTAQGQKKQRDLQRLQEDLQADVERERNDILQKATLKMSEIVKKIAEEKGYDLVVDMSTAVFVKPAMEITNDAIAAYDKAYPVTAAQAAK
jgi:outer membrane protein